ncbi:MAG TPA: hypothetical protein VN878_02965, partial [Usitatibacter sp.]|nr:hypothetical protein [Usitatibacter sp.]
MPLDVLVFDLLVPSDAPAAMREMRLPALEKWLARAAIAREERRPGADWLALKFGLCPPVPVAAIALAGEATSATATGCAKLTALPDEGWLRADPVHLRIDGGSLALHDAAILELTRAEADALVAALQSHFGADGLAFHAPSPDRWYVRVARSLL